MSPSKKEFPIPPTITQLFIIIIKTPESDGRNSGRKKRNHGRLRKGNWRHPSVPSKEGDIITGTVIAVNEEGAILDPVLCAQGVIKAEDMSSDPNFNILEDVKTGDTIEATVAKRTTAKETSSFPRRKPSRCLPGIS